MKLVATSLLVPVLVLVVACQQKAAPDECDRVVDHVLEVKRKVNKASAETWERDVAKWRAEMAPHCRTKFLPEDRACMLAVQTLDDLAKCNAAISSRK